MKRNLSITQLPFLLFACVIASVIPVSAQQGYIRPLTSQDYQSIADMEVTASGEMHVAATKFLYRLNNAGEIVLQKEIKEGGYSEVRAAIPTVDGGDAVLLHALESITEERLVFFQLSLSSCSRALFGSN